MRCILRDNEMMKHVQRVDDKLFYELVQRSMQDGIIDLQ